mgnify:CR=1 FL=1
MENSTLEKLQRHEKMTDEECFSITLEISKGLSFFIDALTLIRVWNISRDFCRLYCSCIGRDFGYISYFFSKGTSGRRIWRNSFVRDGNGENDLFGLGNSAQGRHLDHTLFLGGDELDAEGLHDRHQRHVGIRSHKVNSLLPDSGVTSIETLPS